ncbi:hypothetical protein [Thiolapillus sp.]
MLLDEPTANLDRESRKRTLELLLRLKAEGMTLMISSHDPQHFQELATQRLQLAHGHLHKLDVQPQQDVQSAKVIPLRRDYA